MCSVCINHQLPSVLLHFLFHDLLLSNETLSLNLDLKVQNNHWRVRLFLFLFVTSCNSYKINTKNIFVPNCIDFSPEFNYNLSRVSARGVNKCFALRKNSFRSNCLRYMFEISRPLWYSKCFATVLFSSIYLFICFK